MEYNLNSTTSNQEEIKQPDNNTILAELGKNTVSMAQAINQQSKELGLTFKPADMLIKRNNSTAEMTFTINKNGKEIARGVMDKDKISLGDRIYKNLNEIAMHIKGELNKFIQANNMNLFKQINQTVKNALNAEQQSKKVTQKQGMRM